MILIKHGEHTINESDRYENGKIEYRKRSINDKY